MRNVYICECFGFKDEIHKKTYDEISHEIFDNPSNYSIFVRKLEQICISAALE